MLGFSHPIMDRETIMGETPSVDSTDSEYQAAVDNMEETISDSIIMRGQSQIEDLRDRFKEAIENAGD